VDPRAGLGAVEKREISHYRESNTAPPARIPSLYRMSYPEFLAYIRDDIETNSDLLKQLKNSRIIKKKLWNPNIHCCIHKSPPFFPLLSQIDAWHVNRFINKISEFILGKSCGIPIFFFSAGLLARSQDASRRSWYRPSRHTFSWFFLRV
jgi:hypothetical protein